MNVPRRPSRSTSRGGHGGHSWMMMICCIPMLVAAVALVATGTVGGGFVITALLCVAMMALMMRGMDHGSGRDADADHSSHRGHHGRNDSSKL